METLLAIIIVFYLIAVIILVIQKKNDVLPKGQVKDDDEYASSMDYENSRKWLDYSANLKSAPFLEGYDRPDM